MSHQCVFVLGAGGVHANICVFRLGVCWWLVVFFRDFVGRAACMPIFVWFSFFGPGGVHVNIGVSVLVCFSCFL